LRITKYDDCELIYDICGRNEWFKKYSEKNMKIIKFHQKKLEHDLKF